MLHGEEIVTTRRGTKVRVTWTAPEVGVDITQEEYDERLQRFLRKADEIAQKYGLDIYAHEEDLKDVKQAL